MTACTPGTAPYGTIPWQWCNERDDSHDERHWLHGVCWHGFYPWEPEPACSPGTLLCLLCAQPVLVCWDDENPVCDGCTVKGATS